MTANESVKQTILAHHLVNTGDVLLLGLSGGPDSLCLLYILNSLQTELGFKLYALHVNHMIRGKEADDDEAFVKQVCKDLCIASFVSYKVDVPALSKQYGISEEEMGRKERQRLLLNEKAKIEIKENNHSVKIVLAHNQDDQAETVMLRILRGTGIHGLAAMEYEREDGLIRPLLDTPRSEIEKYCRDHNLEPRIDKTNGENEYTRNKVRNILMPLLKDFNPNIKESLVRLSNSARSDDNFISREVNALYESVVILSNEYVVSLDAKKIKGCDTAIFVRLIKQAFSQIDLSEDISSVHLLALKKALDNNVGNKTIEFPRKYTAYLNKGILELRRPN